MENKLISPSTMDKDDAEQFVLQWSSRHGVDVSFEAGWDLVKQLSATRYRLRWGDDGQFAAGTVFDIDQDIVEALKDGARIRAIKMFRERLPGRSLRESKTVLDEVWRLLPQKEPSPTRAAWAGVPGSDRALAQQDLAEPLEPRLNLRRPGHRKKRITATGTRGPRES